jgi:hypothetical protein
VSELGDFPTLRSVAPTGAERELSLHCARRDGREVATLRCVERAGQYLIECEVYPVSGLRVDPLRPGPYRFTTEGDARGFVDEAVKVLAYLGCDVT